LRNSGREAYSIAVAVGANFIRVNNLVETLLTDSGIIVPEAPNLKSVRINYTGIKVYSDIDCKHATSLSLTMKLNQLFRVEKSHRLEEAIRELVLDAVNRGGADGLIVTGERTGEPPDPKFLRIVKKHSPVPVIIGSGFKPKNAGSLIKYADGVIVGSYIKVNGKAGNPVSEKRARFLVDTIRKLSNNI
ncbi:MAG: photosystem I assembly BtpA, partial [Desulfurococcales archaeon]|nr:photosystem I assembly BtpA [Desulfurococcales archaeon]